ncbi:MAG: hypothetical protein RL069_1798 [Planctomycetota bacterium]
MARFSLTDLLRKVWVNRFGLENLSIRTRLVLMVILLISLFGLIAMQAHRTIIAYIERREKVDLRDEAMNVRANFEKLLNRTESLIIEDSRKHRFLSSEKSLPTTSEDGIQVQCLGKFKNYEDFSRQCGLTSPRIDSNLRRPRRELLDQIMDDHLFYRDHPNLHSYWSKMYWVPNSKNGNEGSQSAKLQVLVRDDLRDTPIDGNPSAGLDDSSIWFYEVDLTQPLSKSILSSVRSFGILVNPYQHVAHVEKNSAATDLAYIPLLDGSPVRYSESDQEPRKIQRFEMGSKLLEAIHKYQEEIQARKKTENQSDDFSLQFPSNDELPEGNDSKISLPDLIVGDNLQRLSSAPWTCKSSAFSPALAKALKKAVEKDPYANPSMDDPLRTVFIEDGQTSRFWLRASTYEGLSRLKQTAVGLYERVANQNQAKALDWESQTSMGSLVLSVASIKPPGASDSIPPVFYIIRAVSLDEIRNSAQEGLSMLLYWGLFISLAALLLTTWLAFRITQPLQKISQVVGQIQETDINSDSEETEKRFQSLLSNLPLDRNDEVGAIAKQLSKTFESILEKNNKIRCQLERTNKADLNRRVAEEANEAKTQFLAMISHDMRQSMNVIFGHLDMLREEPLAPTQKQDVQGVFNSAKKLRYLIDDVLDYQRFLTGDVHVESSECQLEQVLRSVVSIYESNAEENGNQIEFQSYFQKPIVSDRYKIERIVGNLLSNACKFTKRGKVSVVLEQASASQIRIVVEDTGRGMSKEQQEKVFKIQNTAKTRGNRDGTGLGLFICDKLTRSLGGEIQFHSAEGKGTRFEIRIPIEPNMGQSPMGGVDSGVVEEQPVLLIIDDSENSRAAIRRAIESHSKGAFKIIEASSGQQGLRVAREYSPSVITLDVEMPEWDGFQVLQELRSDPVTARIPVLMVTVHADTGKASMLGANGFLRKPFDRLEISREIEKIMRDAGDGLVLLVDDEESCRKELSKLLSSKGIRNATARDGEDALDQIKDEIPSLFIIDLLMPRMDGFALIEKLRSLPETKDTPILVLSALALDSEEIAKLNPMIQRFFGKGTVDLEEIVKEVDRIGKFTSNRNFVAANR